MENPQGQKRVTIENVQPSLDGGRYPIKRIPGENVVVTADIFVDGHDMVNASLLYRKTAARGDSGNWMEVPMEPLVNDSWTATFTPDEPGKYEYTLYGFIDYYGTWLSGLQKKYTAGQDTIIELKIGADLLHYAAERAPKDDAKKIRQLEEAFRNPTDLEATVKLAGEEWVREWMRKYRNEHFATTYPRLLAVHVDRAKALFSAWYELFPRSTATEPGRHGTFADVERLLPRIAEMGFDVLYLPPIHPIGRSSRKGMNNAITAEASDPGSPWAIGGEEGGHKAIHPELGSVEDFEHLVKAALGHGVEIALDYALQCSPDHPYVKEHSDWFVWRPDGIVQYAENPPKKYQDVLPINFETEDWKNLWKELKSILDYWIERGVKIFRVDNPHTKPFVFWEWVIGEIHAKNPEVIFLAEAFTRPRVMEKLAKIGFTQSYTYFTWRDTSAELAEYLTELTKTDLREYFRPNFWPNTPDILPISLERKPEPAFLARIILAGTLSSNYGVYGPIFELGLNEPYPGKEEYIDSEKYEVKHWGWEAKTLTREVMTKLNTIRRENAALQTPWYIAFCKCDNPQLLCYVKTDQDKKNRLIIAVNLDPYNAQSGWAEIPLEFLGLEEGDDLMVRDLLTGNEYNWIAGWNYLELHPEVIPAHIFRIEPLQPD